MKSISNFLASVNSLLAGVIIATSLTSNEIRDVAAWWLLTKLLAAAAVIAIGALSWIGRSRPVNPSLMLLCDLFLVALGAATIVWTLHLGILTGDMEFYMIAGGGSLILQGATSRFGPSNHDANITA